MDLPSRKRSKTSGVHGFTPNRNKNPHAVLYDFEAYGDNNQRKDPTSMLTIENAHVPISVSIGDTLEREPTHICERDPAVLVRKFIEELERRGKKDSVSLILSTTSDQGPATRSG